MNSETVARRYGSALADVIIARGEQDQVQAELGAWQRMIEENDRLLEVFSNPTVAYEQKGRVLNELIVRTQVLPTTGNFLRILLRNQRLTELHQVIEKLGEVLDERGGLISAQVVSARPISESTRVALEEKLGQITGKKMRLSFETDESLLGGIVTRIGSTIYDGSVRNQLRRLRQELAG